MRLIRAENDSDIAPAWDICGGGSEAAAGWCGARVGGAAGKYVFPGRVHIAAKSRCRPAAAAAKSALTPMRAKSWGGVYVSMSVCFTYANKQPRR